MRLANLGGRMAVVRGDRAVDVAEASAGAFGPAPAQVFARWRAFAEWARSSSVADATGRPFGEDELGPPSPTPAQVFAIGVNYAAHGAEAGYPPDHAPSVFTKFPSSLAGPDAEVELSGDRVDWEVELVAVVGAGGRDIPRAEAWDHIAGLTIGQDLSDRAVQLAGASPQFSLGKSYAGYGPTGPLLVTVDELEDPDDLEIGCRLGDEVLQHDRTSRMIYDVPELVARLSAVVELLPGDVVFTGTPAGIGNRREPPRYLSAGDVLVSEIEGLGRLTTRLVARRAAHPADDTTTGTRRT